MLRSMTGPYFHVTSMLNRASIQEHGLDWTRMGAASGIAGSPVPEEAGCFLSEDELSVEFFLHMNNTGGPADVWLVRGVDPEELRPNGSGFYHLPRRVEPQDLELHRSKVPPRHPHLVLPDIPPAEPVPPDGPIRRGLLFEL